ncbi:ATP/GTP-binding protein [Amycolatopsis sp. NPDC051061]|uniref:ATP/GTP-binding protein n=1 Tax=Amycolatopsis sp. NPDC051061 TaxID=3155042 RepID=UPI00341C254D
MTVRAQAGSEELSRRTAAPAADPRPPGKGRGDSRRVRWLDRAGWYEPRETGARSTTRQAEALNLALSSPPTTHRGLILGTDRLSGQLVCHDPFIAYADKLVSAPNVAVVGDVGKGKSSLLKTWGTLRQLLLADRRVVVLDKKTQAGEGEYTPLARAVGAPSIRFTVDGTGSRLNVLDPVIALGEPRRRSGAAGRPTGQMMLLRAVLAEALGRGVTEREGKALRIALLAATRDAHERGRVPVIGDVVHHLVQPAGEAAESIGVPAGELREWGFDPAFALERMIEEDLAGLVDEETSADVQLDHPSGLVHFDISSLPAEGPALRIVMTVINTWQTNMLAQRSQQLMQTVNIVEEGWHLAQGALGRVFQRNTKLARGLGLATLAGFHHVSDLPAGSAARSLLQEAETVFIFGQSLRSDALACVELYDLPAGTEDTIMGLGRGTFLAKIGSEAPLLVQHVRSPTEVRLTETDAALTGRQ